jgi:hypothetical protein
MNMNEEKITIPLDMKKAVEMNGKKKGTAMKALLNVETTMNMRKRTEGNTKLNMKTTMNMKMKINMDRKTNMNMRVNMNEEMN